MLALRRAMPAAANLCRRWPLLIERPSSTMPAKGGPLPGNGLGESGEGFHALLVKPRVTSQPGPLCVCWRPAVQPDPCGEGRRFIESHDPAVQLNRSRTVSCSACTWLLRGRLTPRLVRAAPSSSLGKGGAGWAPVPAGEAGLDPGGLGHSRSRQTGLGRPLSGSSPCQSPAVPGRWHEFAAERCCRRTLAAREGVLLTGEVASSTGSSSDGPGWIRPHPVR